MTTPVVTDMLLRAAGRAALAPSIHNTQPWHFVIDGDVLEIRSDLSRQLSVLDPRARQLTISCGCALFNARVALAAAGFEAEITRLPDPQDPSFLAKISVGAARDWVPIGALDQAIDERRANRREFADELVPAQLVYELVAAARAETIDLLAVTRPEHRAATAELSQLADEIQCADPAYTAELRIWTTDDPRRRDGVQASSVPYGGSLSDIPEDLPIRHFDVRGMGWLPASSNSGADQCLLLFAGTSDGTETWLRTGEALEHVWLELTRQGFAASPLNQVVETASTCEQLRAALQTDLRPAMLLRVGRAPATVQTQRRPLQDVVTRRLSHAPVPAPIQQTAGNRPAG